MKFDTKVAPCTNCHQPISDNYVYGFQGVRICGNCARMVQRALDKMQQQLTFMMKMYYEVLRVALIKGELSFPELPAVSPSEKLRGVSKEQVLQELERMTQQLGALDDDPTLRSALEGGPQGYPRQMHPLRNDPPSGK